MPAPTADEILTQQHARAFLQNGGAGRNNIAEYSGIVNQHLFISSVTNPRSGGITPINVPDPLRLKAWKRVGRTIEAPDFGSYTLTALQRHGSVPKLFNQDQCPITIYVHTGRCVSPGDVNRSYESYSLILEGEVTETRMGDPVVMDGDEALTTEADVTTFDQYLVGPLYFGERATTEVNAEVITGLYATPGQCAGCVGADQWLYTITRQTGSSPTVQPEIIYTTNAGLTWRTADLPAAAALTAPSGMFLTQNYLIVTFLGQSNYRYTTVDPDTGIVSSTAWQNVTSAFAASARATFQLSPNELFVVAHTGTVMKITSIGSAATTLTSSLTSQQLLRIHGKGDTIVAAGGVGAIIVSQDRGRTWATAPTLPTAHSINAVAVVGALEWWVGTSAGTVYYTNNGGKTWTQATNAAPSTASEINDIVFATNNVGYCAYYTSGPVAQMRCTIDGGNTWVDATDTGGRVRSAWPVFDRINKIIAPAGSSQTNANTVALAGLGGDGSDGAVYIGTANSI